MEQQIAVQQEKTRAAVQQVYWKEEVLFSVVLLARHFLWREQEKPDAVMLRCYERHPLRLPL